MNTFLTFAALSLTVRTRAGVALKALDYGRAEGQREENMPLDMFDHQNWQSQQAAKLMHTAEVWTAR